MHTAPTTPLTKNQSRVRNDMRATSRYARRRDIDQRLADLKLARQLRDPLS